MTSHSHGRDDTTPEIFTDDAAEPVTPQRAGRTAPSSISATPIDTFLEDEEELSPVAIPRLAADPWTDVHPEPIVVPGKAAAVSAKPQAAWGKEAAPRAIVTVPPEESGVDDVDTDPDPTTPDNAGGWTIPMLCAGLAIIAACILVPLAEENHQLVYQRERLKLDLEQVQKQVAVNDEFLKRIDDDPALAERLAQRQMKTIRRGEAVLDLPSRGREETSPFMLVTVPPPAAMPPYHPVGGMLAAATRYPRTRLFLLGGGLFLVMFGLVLGYSKD